MHSSVTLDFRDDLEECERDEKRDMRRKLIIYSGGKNDKQRKCTVEIFKSRKCFTDSSSEK